MLQCEMPAMLNCKSASPYWKMSPRVSFSQKKWFISTKPSGIVLRYDRNACSVFVEVSNMFIKLHNHLNQSSVAKEFSQYNRS